MNGRDPYPFNTTGSGIPEKPFWQSKALWGPVIALFGLLADIRGWGSVDQAALLGALDQVLTYGGIALGFYGRVVAQEKIVLRRGG